MEKILIFLGDSYGKSGVTDYELLIENNIIESQKINFFDFIKSLSLYKRKDSIYKLSQDIREKNSWANRLSVLLKIDYLNLSMMGASWQTVFNQILYSLLEYKEKEIIFIIAPPINERILIDRVETSTINMDLYDLYGVEENFNSSFFLNNHCFYHYKNKLNVPVNFLFKEEELKNIYSLFTKKVFNIYNLHAIMNILHLLVNEKIKFFFLPSWYETIKFQMEDIVSDSEFLNKFIFSKINKKQLELKSPFLLKKFKKNKFSPHPSFDSQELIANYYYDFLKDEI